MPDDNKLPLRAPLIIHAYLNDLADWGTFGKGKNGVAMRLMEDGIQREIDNGRIQKRSAKDFADSEDKEPD